MFAQIDKCYFIGIGGIGMSALARWFVQKGCFVAGYDRTPTDLTHQLEAEGMSIHFEDDPALIPPVFTQSPRQEVLVVYTPAIPANHKEWHFFQQQGFTIRKRAEVLAQLTHNHFTIAIAGTHGKTTTTSLLAHILYNSNIAFTAFAGGIIQGYEQNLLHRAGARLPEVMLVEADEYDKSFLHLQPDLAVITAMDADHLDIYGNESHLIATFQEFAQKIKEGGHIFVKKGLPIVEFLNKKNVTFAEYSITEKSDYYTQDIQSQEDGFGFDWFGPQQNIKNLRLGMPGFHNVENATVAIALARQLGIDEDTIRTSLATFKGVRRRFEYIVKQKDRVMIDDYAHHPREIEALLRSVRALYPAKKITAVFQPHLYSRTRDLAEGFAQSLDLADEIILLEIYPAREQPIPGVDSTMILNKMKNKAKRICPKAALLACLQENYQKLEVLLTIGAGDISEWVLPLKEMMSENGIK
ncbi:MAG: UDP-N-acetylmuramate--L-alanine ligase [Microscillaceae bacterium]